ncbi:ATP-binding protein [Phenylobacterium sp.]
MLFARRVLGADNPRSLAQHIRPDNWRPVDAEVRVSNPVHLARTLGGRNLYGRGVIAPFRELVQNATDAIRARRLLEDRPASWGKIRITLEPDKASTDEIWLHVDDNGIGMSERVLSGPLIDFGRSIWNSPMLREEFPGLQSKNINPVGKFGIGFFSVFELGDYVQVISKHYDSGSDSENVLEFK